MARFTALLDACVLYRAPVRDLLIQIAKLGIYRARWSSTIQEEWVRSLLAARPDRDPRKLERTCLLMEQAVPDACVTGFEHLIDELDLPDENDRHVLAAAIVGRADVIVTYNLVDFPQSNLEQFGIDAQHPDVFLIHQRSINEQTFLMAVRSCRTRLQNPPKSADEYIEILQRHELTLVADELRPVHALI